MENIFHFGEKLEEFEVRVLNEREVRAGAGISFFFALISFQNAWLTGNFYFTKIFVIAFLIDFFIRIFINPKFSPSLIIGRFAVRNQKPEYVGAPQKRFAWGMGFILGVLMFFLLVVNNTIGPINLLICSACIIFFFFESVFGICLGCKIYNTFNKEKAKLCPGGTCEIIKKDDIQKIGILQITITILFLGLIISIPSFGIIKPSNTIYLGNNSNSLTGNNITNTIDDECEIPEWVKKIGHEDKYRLHHGCTTTTSNKGYNLKYPIDSK